MKTVTITEPFDGYPHGSKPGSKRVSYAKGDEPEVSDAFAALIVGKGLAREKAPGSKPPNPPTPDKPAIAADYKKETTT